MRYLILLLLCSCAGMSPTQVGTGAAIGAAGTAMVKKAQEALKPEYPLMIPSAEICELTEAITVKCYILNGCEYNCESEMLWADFIALNPKVKTLRSSAIPAIYAYCEANGWEYCKDQMAKYTVQGVYMVVE